MIRTWPQRWRGSDRDEEFDLSS